MKVIAGVDEVGRGSLIGPVYAAAVILNNSINKKLLKDSKKLTKTKREILAKYIKKNSVWAIGKATVKEIKLIGFFSAPPAIIHHHGNGVNIVINGGAEF